mmetsp:Transcript_72428/g.130358  ORF Transcript_72428/g.130358 Transcript_72428/m.130358 type:complete len:136 (+) Transcript_72428:103-510(+)
MPRAARAAENETSTRLAENPILYSKCAGGKDRHVFLQCQADFYCGLAQVSNPLVSAVNKFFSARDYPQKGPLKRKGVSCTTGTLDTNSWKAYAVMATMARRPFLTSASAMKLVRPFGSMPAMGVENPLRFRGSKP